MDNKQEYKKLLLKTFKAFDELCKANDIVYYIGYGTAIGAVRHKGLIPWDDDIDVHMPIESYMRFLSLKGKLSIPYRIDDLRDKGYFKSFAKFSDAQTTLVQGHDLPYVYGVYVDIFPLFEGGKEDWQRLEPLYKKYSWKYEMGSRIITLNDLLSTLKNNGLRAFLGKLKYCIYYKSLKPYYLEKFKEIFNMCSQCKGDYLMTYDVQYNGCFPKEWFSSTIEIKFENQTCKIMKGYHDYLTYIYGDYMTPPPIDVQQKPTHPYWYMNLDKYMTLSEVRKVMKEEARMR